MRFNITLKMKYLLPGTQYKASSAYGHSQRRSHQCCLEVGVSITVMPCLFMPVRAAGGYELIQYLGKIARQARLKLYCSDTTGTSHIENMNTAGLDSRPLHNLGNLAGDVMYVTVSGCADQNLFLVNHIPHYPRTAAKVQQKGW